MENALLLCKWTYAEEDAYLVPHIVPDDNEVDEKEIGHLVVFDF